MPGFLLWLVLAGLIILAAMAAGLAAAFYRLHDELQVVRKRLSTVESRLSDQVAEPTPAREAASVEEAAARDEPRASGPTLIRVPNLARKGAPAGARLEAELGLRFGPIWELADAGMPAEAIARSTGHPVGQVELILGLRRQAAAGETGS